MLLHRRRRLSSCFIFLDAKDEKNYSGGEAAKQTSYQITILGAQNASEVSAPARIIFITYLPNKKMGHAGNSAGISLVPSF
jgi:hypothetical protein